MYTTSFLFGVLLVVGYFETPQAYSADSSVQLLLDTFNLTCDTPLEKRLLCLKYGKYRTFDGTCNNLCNITIGAAFTPHARFAPAAYVQPGFQPRQFSVVAGTGGPLNLPNTRQVSKKVFRNAPVQGNFTHVTMTWGQFMDHDVTLTEFTVGVNPQVDCGGPLHPCPSLASKPDCFGVNITIGNDLLNKPQVRCTPLSRSERNEAGEQINEITAHMDGSQVYGSDLETADSLRLFKKGLLLVDPFVKPDELPVLPAAESSGGEAGFCRSSDLVNEPCFRAGDPRVNENQALMAMHALWVREHNRIAKSLYAINPSWGDEKLYQEARRIVGAKIQHITYNEWLPALIPSKALREEGGIQLKAPGTFFDGYDPSVKTTVSNAFATAGFRIGHTLIREEFSLRTAPRFNDLLALSTVTFFDPSDLYNVALGVNPYTGFYMGLVFDRGLEFDANVADSVRENLIIPGPGSGPSAGLFGDLPAINMQRGRDHGLPSYVTFLDLCDVRKLDLINKFSDLNGIVSTTQQVRLDSGYRSVLDVDLFAGLLSENKEPGSELGPTTNCLFFDQFSRARSGDRFWYERNDTCTGFSIEQLDEIRKTSLARVICDNSDNVATIQPQVFLRRTNNGGPNDDVSCFNLPHVDLTVFKESPKYGPKKGGYRSGSVLGTASAATTA